MALSYLPHALRTKILPYAPSLRAGRKLPRKFACRLAGRQNAPMAEWIRQPASNWRDGANFSQVAVMWVRFLLGAPKLKEVKMNFPFGKRRKIVSTNWRLKALLADEINENCILSAQLKAVEHDLERERKERISLQTQVNLLRDRLKQA